MDVKKSSSGDMTNVSAAALVRIRGMPPPSVVAPFFPLGPGSSEAKGVPAVQGKTYLLRGREGGRRREGLLYAAPLIDVCSVKRASSDAYTHARVVHTHTHIAHAPMLSTRSSL